MKRRGAACKGFQAISCDGLKGVNVGSRLETCYEKHLCLWQALVNFCNFGCAM